MFGATGSGHGERSPRRKNPKIRLSLVLQLGASTFALGKPQRNYSW
jgi:hypothetical protein